MIKRHRVPDPLVQASDVREALSRALDLHHKGEFREAEIAYKRVLRARPDHFDALHMLGVAALQKGNSARAVDLISRAILQKTSVASAHSNLALALMQLNRVAEAIASYERQISLQPNCVDAYVRMASALGQLKRAHEALTTCDRAVLLHPDAAQAHLARAVALKDLERHEESLAACDRAIERRPDWPVAWDKRAAALRDLARFDESLASSDNAIALQPDFALAYLHAGMVCLQRGDFERGLPLHEWRTKPGGTVAPRNWRKPLWTDDRPLEGSTILLHSEQGLGDTIQFCRYAKLAEARGAQVILSVQPPLCRLMTSLSPTIHVCADGTALPAFDWQCLLMSLPLAFQTTVSSIPFGGDAYLFAEPNRIAQWRDRLGAEGFKIGICWQGTQLPIDVGRSFPLALFHRLSFLPGVRLISLQKGAGTEQLNDMPAGMRVEVLGSEWDNGRDAFLDTAGIMHSLDLVISSDTSIAHLAGALGRQTWVALKHVPDWRWMLEREDSPWYSAHRLFRQARCGDWESVFEQMRVALMNDLAGR